MELTQWEQNFTLFWYIRAVKWNFRSWLRPRQNGTLFLPRSLDKLQQHETLGGRSGESGGHFTST